MYWWNVKALAEDFREGLVTERERFKYYMAFTVVFGIGSLLLPYIGREFTMPNLGWYIASVIITIVGTILRYRGNKRGDNADFIGRMICLTWPIGIKVSVLLIVVWLVSGWLFIGIMQKMYTGDQGREIFFAISGLGSHVCYYWLMYKYITIVAGRKGELTGQS